MALATFAITNDDQFLLVTNTVTGDIESLNLDQIKDITYVFLASAPSMYSYPAMAKLTVEINGRSADLHFDLAAVTNQAGWLLTQAGCIQAEADIRGWINAASGGAGLATETTQLANQALLTDIELNTNEDATVLTSNSTTGSGTIPASSKAATVFIEGVGGSVNGVVRPNGWSQTFEFNNDLLPSIPYDGNGVATVYVDYLT